MVTLYTDGKAMASWRKVTYKVQSTRHMCMRMRVYVYTHVVSGDDELEGRDQHLELGQHGDVKLVSRLSPPNEESSHRVRWVTQQLGAAAGEEGEGGNDPEYGADAAAEPRVGSAAFAAVSVRVEVRARLDAHLEARRIRYKV